MAINFPNTPSNGDVSGNFTYDSSIPGWRKTPENSASLPAGTIVQWPGATAPANWLLCQGQAVSRTTYASLFAAIGVQYGAGDGTTTFNLPNLKGRVAVGLDSSQTEFDTLGETGGAKTHTLSISEMPSHTHIQDAHTHIQNSHNHTQDPHSHSLGGTLISSFVGYGQNSPINGNATNPSSGGVNSTTATNQATTATNQNTTATNQNTGGGGAHNNLQPYIVLNYIIKTSAGITSGDSELATRVGAVEAANNATPLGSNHIINGALDVWQRGTSNKQSTGAGAAYVSADRWKVGSYGAAPDIWLQRSTDIPSSTGLTYSATFAWNTSTSTGDVFLAQFIEDGKYKFAGKTVTVSFYAKATTAMSVGAAFDQDYFGTNFSLTTSWARYSWTVTLPSTYQTSYPSGSSNSNHTELRLFRMANVSAAANTIYFTGVQVEEGPYATPFRRNASSIQAELAACQRYYWRQTGTQYVPYASGWSLTGTTARAIMNLPVTMRANPSIEISNLIWTDNSAYDLTISAITLAYNSTQVLSLQVTNATGATQYRPGAIETAPGQTGYLGFSAEL